MKKLLSLLLTFTICVTVALPALNAYAQQLSDEWELLNQIEKNGVVTLSDLEQNGISVYAADNGNISLDYFNFVSIASSYDKLNEDFKNIHMKDGVPQGTLADRLPKVLDKSWAGDSQVQIMYVRSRVNDTQIYHVGKLNIGGQELVYYITDEDTSHQTVYSILRPNEKIQVEYRKASVHSIEYKFWNSQNNQINSGPNGLSLDDVFGKDRATVAETGVNTKLNVKIPRGYKAQILAYRDENCDGVVDTSESGTFNDHGTLGQMKEYKLEEDKVGTRKKIVQIGDNDTVYSLALSNDQISSNLIVVCKWEKQESFTFRADLWNKQVYANGRIDALSAENGSVATGNSAFVKTFANDDNHSFTWCFKGKTSDSITWELDQLEVNGTPIDVPTTTLNHPKAEAKVLPSKTTTLPTGTEVVVTVTDWGGTNGTTAYRNYRIDFNNVYEDITITGGNMLSHTHREVVIDKLTGVKAPQYYVHDRSQTDKFPGFWSDLHQNSLISRKTTGKVPNHTYSDPFRFKRQNGYYGKPNVQVLTKDGDLIQKNSQTSNVLGNNVAAIEYLVLKDNASTACPNLFKEENKAYGLPVNRNPEYGYMRGGGAWDPFRVVSYEDWKESSDGYYYFRMTSPVQAWMDSAALQNALLLSIIGIPMPGAIDYVNGADESGKTAPLEKNIINMPSVDLGGDTGYNCVDHSIAIIASNVPSDKSEKFLFSHWEVLAVELDGNGYFTGKVTNTPLTIVNPQDNKETNVKFSPSKSVKISSAFDSVLSNGFCWNEDYQRFTITLRAVWVNVADIDYITYETRYFINGNQVQHDIHNIPEGAPVVTNVYKDDQNKVFSDSLQSVIDGNNYDNRQYKGKYILDPKTTMYIESVTNDKRIAYIYLVRTEMDVNVQKVWNGGPDDHDAPTEVQFVLQRQYVAEGANNWVMINENGEPEKKLFTLNRENRFSMSFKSLPRYENNDISKEYRYRTMEVDPNTVAQTNYRLVGTGEKWQSTCGNKCTYLVHYNADYTPDMDRDITIVNTYMGANDNVLVVGKTVSGSANRNAYFEFKITVKDTSLSNMMSVPMTEGKYGDAEFKIVGQYDDEGVMRNVAEATIKLKAGNLAFVRNLPEFVDVEVQEVLPPLPDYIPHPYHETTVSYGDYDSDNFTFDEKTLVTQGTLTPGIHEVIYNNHREEAKPISVTKTVSGNMGDYDKDWVFNITIDEPYNQSFAAKYTDKDGNIIETGIVFTPNEETQTSSGQFSLTHAQSVEIIGLPDGVKYTIEEVSADKNGYKTTYSKIVTQDLALNDQIVQAPIDEYCVENADYPKQGIDGFATLEYNDTITVTNYKQMNIDIGVALDVLPYVIILSLCAGGVIYFAVRRINKRKGR